MREGASPPPSKLPPMGKRDGSLPPLSQNPIASPWKFSFARFQTLGATVFERHPSSVVGNPVMLGQHRVDGLWLALAMLNFPLFCRWSPTLLFEIVSQTLERKKPHEYAIVILPYPKNDDPRPFFFADQSEMRTHLGILQACVSIVSHSLKFVPSFVRNDLMRVGCREFRMSHDAVSPFSIRQRNLVWIDDIHVFESVGAVNFFDGVKVLNPQDCAYATFTTGLSRYRPVPRPFSGGPTRLSRPMCGFSAEGL